MGGEGAARDDLVQDASYRTRLILSCGFFMACSAGMMIANKMVLRAVGLPITVVMIQMAFTVVCLVVLPCGLHFGSMRDVMRWSLTVPVLFTLMLATSMLALDHASMGAIVVVRNVAPLVTMAIEPFFGEKVAIDAPTVGTLLYIISGVLLYVSHDLTFTPVGLGYMVSNMVFSVLERILQRKMIAVEPIDVSKTGMMLLNNSVALVPMGLLLYLKGEHAQWHGMRDLGSGAWMLLGVSCVNAVGISWAGINAQGYVTATTFMVLTNLNKFVVIGFGIIVLHEAKSWQAVAGCLVALSGGLLYARIKSAPPPPVKPAEVREPLVGGGDRKGAFD